MGKFVTQLGKLDILHNKYQDKVENYLDEVIKRIELEENITTDEYKKMTKYEYEYKHEVEKKNPKIDIIITAVEIIGLLLIGIIILLNDGNAAGMYFGGLIFFIAGVLIGLKVEYAGLIFLISHGCTGLYLMLSSIIGSMEAFNDFLASKKSSLFQVVLIFIVAILSTVVYNVSHKLKEQEYSMPIIIGLYALGIIITFITFRSGYLRLLF